MYFKQTPVIRLKLLHLHTTFTSITYILSFQTSECKTELLHL
jgi:hypothetical protein